MAIHSIHGYQGIRSDETSFLRAGNKNPNDMAIELKTEGGSEMIGRVN